MAYKINHVNLDIFYHTMETISTILCTALPVNEKKKIFSDGKSLEYVEKISDPTLPGKCFMMCTKDPRERKGQ